MNQTSRLNQSYYIPQQGDIVYINFHPQRGHEQKGSRPALVISNQLLSQKSSLAFFLPITKTKRAYPTHVYLDERTEINGSIMCEQLKSLDYTARGIQFIEKIPTDLLEEVQDILQAIIE